MAEYLHPTNSGYLEGQLLIATPSLRGSCFEKSVIYICSHNAQGAMGVVVNHTLGDLKCSDIFAQMNLETDQIKFDLPVHFGGPVETFKGLVLHTSDIITRNTQTLPQGMAITSNVDILQKLTSQWSKGKGLVALGYAGWGAGQLEEEIKANSWITTPATQDIIFDTADAYKWDKAAALVGVNLAQYCDYAGHA